jgi:hypothetical protein
MIALKPEQWHGDCEFGNKRNSPLLPCTEWHLGSRALHWVEPYLPRSSKCPETERFLRCPQGFDLSSYIALRVIWASHFFIADVNQTLRKQLKFSTIWLNFRRQHVVMSLNRRLHLYTTARKPGLDHGIGHFTHSPPQQSASDRRITYLKSIP